MIPASTVFDQSTFIALLDLDPVVADYRTFFSSLDWSIVEHWEAQQSKRGRSALTSKPFCCAFAKI